MVQLDEVQAHATRVQLQTSSAKYRALLLMRDSAARTQLISEFARRGVACDLEQPRLALSADQGNYRLILAGTAAVRTFSGLAAARLLNPNAVVVLLQAKNEPFCDCSGSGYDVRMRMPLRAADICLLAAHCIDDLSKRPQLSG